MRRSVVVGFSFLVSVCSLGLDEEFTWTRLSYAWSRESRFGGYGHPHHSPGIRPNPANAGADPIFFPGQTNRPQQPPNGQNRPRPPPTLVPETTNLNSGNQVGAGQDRDRDRDDSDYYIYQNNVPMGANLWRNKLFISVPRRRLGVPSSLNFVWVNSTERHNVPLIPYPNWETASLTNNGGERIISVYRVAIDVCDRLWMVDTGQIEIPGNLTVIERPKLVIIDLNTDTIIHTYTLRNEDTTPNSALPNIVVDVSPNACEDAFAYVPDLGGYGVIAYSLKDNISWRVSHNFFFLEPLAGEFRIGGHTFQWNDGVFSLALSDVDRNGFRNVYFHSMAGTHIYSVSTRVLRNRELATRPYHGEDFSVVGDRPLGYQSSASDLHKASGVLFLGLVNQNALGCWNTRKRFSIDNLGIVQKDDERMIYPCDVKVYRDGVIVLTNTMPVFLYGRLNYDQVNFRVWMNNVASAIEGTPCSMRN